MNAEKFFHAKPDNWNCAQAILKAYQEEFNIPEELIIEFRAWGGGRVAGGLCGALYSAEYLANRHHLAPVRQDFLEKAGDIACLALKEKQKISCIKCVQIADEIIENRLKNRNL